MPDHRSFWRLIVGIVVVACVYFVAAKAGLRLALVQANATPIWPPTGLALAALLLLGVRYWPGVLLGAALANLTTAGTPVAASLLVGAGNTAAGVAGAVGLRRFFGFDPGFWRWRDVRAFLLFAVVMTPLVSATNGTLQIGMFGLSPQASLVDVWWTWYCGDSLGILVVAPVILVWASRPLAALSRWRLFEGLAVATCTAGICFVVFGRPVGDAVLGAGMAFTVFPLLLWAAIRFGQRGAATFAFAASTAALVGTVLHQGPFAAQVLHRQLPLLQLFVVVLAGAGMALARFIEERGEREGLLLREVEARRRAEAALRRAHDELECRVEARTAELAAANTRLQTEVAQRTAAEQELRSYRDHLEELVARRTRELADARDRAEAADRLKSVFLATMSHELRTPLNSIIGFTGILLQRFGGPLTEEQERQLGMVKASASHLLRLINDILDLSKIEAGQLQLQVEPFDVVQSTTQVMELVRPLAEKKGLALVHDVSRNVGTLTSDRRRVEQVLLNLLSNAVKFTALGEVRLHGAARGDRLELTISDTGVGIRHEDLPRLFQPFQQLDDGSSHRREGTGLGLSISKKLVERLGGTLAVVSEPGYGTTVTLALPRDIRAEPPQQGEGACQ